MVTTEALPLKAEFDYYLAHKDELFRQYGRKYIVIKDAKVLGCYDSPGDALHETRKSHEQGTFLIQLLEQGDAAHTAHYHSRVRV